MPAIPNTLEDVTTLHADEGRFGIATPTEAAPFLGHLDPLASVQGEIDEWRLLAFRSSRAEIGHFMLFALGRNAERGEPLWLGPVEVIDLDRGRIAAADPGNPNQQIIYGLEGDQRLDEPPAEDLHHLCVQLRDGPGGEQFCRHYGVPNLTANYVLAVLE